jgi:SAM-dependent methyltransferase
MHQVISACRSCGTGGLHPILSLGETPLADALVDPARLDKPEASYPLEVAFCAACSLVQLKQTVSPETLFTQDYPYYSSFSDTLVSHARRNAERLITDEGLDQHSLVVELASNDGYLLRHFAEQGVPVLGIDPAEGPASAAQEAGIPTLCAFFDRELAACLVAEGKRAEVVLANNVLAHVPDLNGFVAGIGVLLAGSGVAVIEAPYVRDLIDRCEFDTIYHEHLCYFSVTALNRLFARHGLVLSRVEHYPLHGGSLRLYVRPGGEPDDTVRRYLAEEAEHGLDMVGYYRDFAARVEQVKHDLLALLGKLKASGARIAAYGAAAKGATLLNYVGIGSETLDYVVDRNVHKQGRFMPGVRLPIADPARLVADQPDYVLLLAWNFADEILAQQQAYLRAGGRFVVPVPEPAVLERSYP